MRAKPDERYQDLDVMAAELTAIRQRIERDTPERVPPTEEAETTLRPSSDSRVRTYPTTPAPAVVGEPAGQRTPGEAHAQRSGDGELPTTETSRGRSAIAARLVQPWWVWAGVAASVVAAVIILGPPLSRQLAVDPDVSGRATTVPSPIAATSPEQLEPAATEPLEAAIGPAEPADPPPTPAADTAPARVPDEPATEQPVLDTAGNALATRDPLAELRQQAEDAFIQGDREASLTAAAAVLRLEPDDPEAARVFDGLERDARQVTARARESVDRPGAETALYERALGEESDARHQLAQGRRESAIRGLWRASALFEQAAMTASPAPNTDPSDTTPSAGPVQVAASAEQTAATRLDPAPTPPVPAPSATGAAEDAATRRADVDGIADALDRYRAAYEQLDGEALEQVFPSAPQETIAALQNFQAYAVTMNSLSPEVDGNTATVTSQLSLTMTARTGITRQVSGPAVFQLERRGPGEWLILHIDTSQVR